MFLLDKFGDSTQTREGMCICREVRERERERERREREREEREERDEREKTALGINEIVWVCQHSSEGITNRTQISSYNIESGPPPPLSLSLSLFLLVDCEQLCVCV
jgi:hypothetical protein